MNAKREDETLKQGKGARRKASAAAEQFSSKIDRLKRKRTLSTGTPAATVRTARRGPPRTGCTH